MYNGSKRLRKRVAYFLVIFTIPSLIFLTSIIFPRTNLLELVFLTSLSAIIAIGLSLAVWYYLSITSPQSEKYTKTVILNPEVKAPLYIPKFSFNLTRFFRNILRYIQSQWFIQQSQYEEAISKLTKIIESTNKSSKELSVIYFYRANAYCNIQKYRESITDYDAAIELEPKKASYYYNRGITYEDFGDLDNAINDFKYARELFPNYINAIINLGNVYSEKAEFTIAIDLFKEIIHKTPNSAVVRNNLGYTYFKQDNFKDALREWDRAIELDSSLDFVFANQALAHIRTGEREKAYTQYKKALILNTQWSDPNHGRSHNWSDDMIESGFQVLKIPRGEMWKKKSNADRSSTFVISYNNTLTRRE